MSTVCAIILVALSTSLVCLVLICRNSGLICEVTLHRSRCWVAADLLSLTSTPDLDSLLLYLILLEILFLSVGILLFLNPRWTQVVDWALYVHLLVS